jgi:hypothetical protein
MVSFEWKLIFEIFQATIWQGLCEFTGGYMGHTNLPSSSSALVASALENVLSHE